MDQREIQIWKDYCDALEPLADVMVKRFVIAIGELGVERGKELLNEAFSLIFDRATERLAAEVARYNRTVRKPERTQ